MFEYRGMLAVAQGHSPNVNPVIRHHSGSTVSLSDPVEPLGRALNRSMSAFGSARSVPKESEMRSIRNAKKQRLQSCMLWVGDTGDGVNNKSS